jgi:hypothetical protein
MEIRIRFEKIYKIIKMSYIFRSFKNLSANGTMGCLPSPGKYSATI